MIILQIVTKYESEFYNIHQTGQKGKRRESLNINRIRETVTKIISSWEHTLRVELTLYIRNTAT